MLLKEFADVTLTLTCSFHPTVRTSLNPEQIRHLTELYSANKNPTLGLLQTWSSLLKVKTTVVTDWIEEKNKLPSPAPTVSPEPNLPSVYRRSTSVSTPLSVPSPVIANARFALLKPRTAAVARSTCSFAYIASCGAPSKLSWTSPYHGMLHEIIPSRHGDV